MDAHIIEELSKCEWIEQGKNLVITGKTSSVKRYLANALCICALRQFKTVRYIKASQLINELSKAEKLDNYQEELSIYAGYDLLVVDDFVVRLHVVLLYSAGFQTSMVLLLDANIA